MFHHGQDTRRTAARPLAVGPIGVAVAAVQGVEVSRLVGRVDGHAGKARLFEVVDTSREQRVDPGGSHGGSLGWRVISSSTLFVCYRRGPCWLAATPGGPDARGRGWGRGAVHRRAHA